MVHLPIDTAELDVPNPPRPCPTSAKMLMMRFSETNEISKSRSSAGSCSEVPPCAPFGVRVHGWEWWVVCTALNVADAMEGLRAGERGGVIVVVVVGGRRFAVKL